MKHAQQAVEFARDVIEAKRAADEQDVFLENQCHLGNSVIGLAYRYLEQSDLTFALESAEEAQSIFNQALESNPNDPSSMRGVSIVQNNLGRIREKQGKIGEAFELFVDAKVKSDVLWELDSTNPLCQRDRTLILENLGRVLEKKGYFERALELHKESVGICEAVACESHNPSHQRDLSIGLDNVGIVLEKQERCEEALEYFNRSLGFWQVINSDDSDNQSHQYGLVLTCYRVGRAARGANQRELAIGQLERASDITQSLIDKESAYHDLPVILEAILKELALARTGSAGNGEL